MILPELIKTIQERIQELEIIYNQENPELEFFSSFFENNNTNSIEGIKSINICDFITAYLKSHNQSLSIEQIKEEVVFDEDFIEYSTSTEFETIMAGLNYIVDTQSSTDLEKIINEKNEIIKNKLLTKMIKEKKLDSEEIKSLMFILSDYERKNIKIMDFIALFSKYEETFHELIALIYTIKLACETYDKSIEYINSISEIENIKVKEKTKEKEANKNVRQLIKMEIFDQKLNGIREYYHTIMSKEKNKKRTCKKTISVYNNLIATLLKEFKKEEITNYPQLIAKIPDENIRTEVLKLIHSHNLEYYNNLKSTYEELAENSILKYQVLLQEYGVQKDEYYVDLIMKNSYEDTKYILEKLKKLNILEKDAIIEILQTSNKNIVDNIFRLIEKGILQINFIKHNKKIFDEYSQENKNLNENLNYLEEKNINALYFSNSQEILLLNSNEFSERMKILEKYELISSMNNEVKYDFFKEKDLDIRIDKILELGYEKMLEKDLNLLNYNDIKWKRIRILKELNIPINKEDLEEVLSTTKFMIADENLDDYIYNAVPYNLSIKINNLTSVEEKEETDLKLFPSSNRVYNIGGILISKNKVKRNLEKLQGIEMESKEKLLLGIISGSTLNDEEIKVLKDTINNNITKRL